MTVLCVAAAFALFGVLQGVSDNFDSAANDLERTADKLFVSSRISRVDPLPLSHLYKIERLANVAAVVPSSYLLGYYQDPANWVGGYAVDIESEFDVFNHFRIDADAIERMTKARTGAIIGRTLAERHGWSIGDRVPLISQVWQKLDGSYDWSFEIVGVYDAENSDDAAAFLINYGYFDEERAFGKGGVAGFWVRLQSGLHAPSVSRSIDELFMNSSAETLTQSGRELALNRVRQLGDIERMVSAVVGSTLLLILFVVANTMRQSADERLREFGVMRALGFTAPYIWIVIFAEAVILSGVGAILGLGLSAYLITSVPEQYGEFHIQASTMRLGLALALLLAIASSLVPATRATSLPIVAALGRRT